jgi:hypothetical protein
MDVRNIYVHPGDVVVVHVIENTALSKTRDDWQKSKQNPLKFRIIAEKNGVTVDGSIPEVGVKIGQAPRRLVYTGRG